MCHDVWLWAPSGITGSVHYDSADTILDRIELSDERPAMPGHISMPRGCRADEDSCNVHAFIQYP